ncbi:MAG: hypothetical protein AB4368_09980 [Xenococcaceae cyanobacterium]
MSTTFLISFISYSFVAVVSIVFGLIYLIKNQFMPYHSEALGLSWSDLKPNFQVLILALMRAVGGGFLATGLTMLILLIIPYRAGEIWSIYAIPAISLCTSSGTLYATWLVKTRTPGNPPLGLSLLALGLTIIGFIFSLI